MDDLSVSGCSGIGFGSEERTKNQGMETREWQRLCAADVRGGIKTEGATTRDTNWACGFMRPIEDQYQKCCAAKKRWIGRFNFLIKTVMALFWVFFFIKQQTSSSLSPVFKLKQELISWLLSLDHPNDWKAFLRQKYKYNFFFLFFFLNVPIPHKTTRILNNDE